MDRYLNVLAKFRSEIMKQKNVIGVGVGHKEVGLKRTKQLSVVVFVEKKLPPKNLKRNQIVPSKIDGVDTDVVEVGRIKLLTVPAEDLPSAASDLDGGSSRTQKVRPAVPGCSIGHYRISAGTLGAVVKDRTTGEKLILSNNHILANGTNGADGRAVIGDPILQPGKYDGGELGDRIAKLLRYVPINRGFGEQQSQCAYASGFSAVTNAVLHLIRPNYEVRVLKKMRQSNVVDCALAVPDQPDLIAADIIAFGSVQGMAEARPGMPVKKSGRTTGVTSGTVVSVGTSLKVEMDGGEMVMFNEQVTTDMRSQGGDSGSLVLTPDNKVVGLLFAGSDKITVFNRIQNVVEALNIEF